MEALAGIFVAFALLIGLVGIVVTSEATSGVGLIAFACLLGIFARMAQASAHASRLEKKAPKQKPTDNPLGLTPQEAARARREYAMAKDPIAGMLGSSD